MHGPSEPWEAHKHLVFSRETAQWTCEGNSLGAMRSLFIRCGRSCAQVSGGMWNGTSCLFCLQGRSAGSAEQGRDPASPSTTSIGNQNTPRSPA